MQQLQNNRELRKQNTMEVERELKEMQIGADRDWGRSWRSMQIEEDVDADYIANVNCEKLKKIA